MSTAAVRGEEPDEAAFGFWLYLMSDAVLFGLLFAMYVVLAGGTDGGPSGADLFSLRNLTLQTALLLASTLTVALSLRAAQAGREAGAVLWLGLTALLGAGFLALELSELAGFVRTGAGPDRSGFLSAYFGLVGTHGLHVAVGVLWALTLVVQLAVRGPSARVVSRLGRLALFWHFLDIVWIGVFSVVYLPVL